LIDVVAFEFIKDVLAAAATAADADASKQRRKSSAVLPCAAFLPKKRVSIVAE
jgi:hypothetical protein